MKIVVGASSFADGSTKPLDFLESKGIEVVKNPFGRRLTEDEIIEHLKGADGLLAGLEPLNERVFAASPQLKAVARIGIGVDNVDFDAAKKHNIKVSNTPDGPTHAVAEMTTAALLSMIHNIIPMNAEIHNGCWKKMMGKSIVGLKVLIIGYGHIGKYTANMLKSLGAEILVYDKFLESESTCSLEEGLSKADAISIHISGNDELINSDEIEMMKDGVIILNSSRGRVINEDAIYNALKSGKISSFWGDALWEEPYTGKISECENAILTPHACTYTTSCRESMEVQAVENLLRDLGF